MYDMDSQRPVKAKQSWLLVILGMVMVLCLGVSAMGAVAVKADSSTTAIFGKTSVGAHADWFAAHRKQVNEYSLPVAGAVSKLSVYLAATATSHRARHGHHRGVGPTNRLGHSGRQVLEGVIYSDAGGTPGELLATSNELVFTSTSASCWYDLTFPTPLHLPAGNYWVGVLTGAKAGVAGYRYDRVARVGRYNATAGSIDPFGTAATDGRQMSLYATYTADAMFPLLPVYPTLPVVSAPTAPVPQAPQPPGESGPPVEEGPPIHGQAPVNSGLPTITGTAQQGQTLTEHNGSWTNNPTSLAYQWLRCDGMGNSCVSISGATSQTHELTALDVHHTIRVQEVATNAGGSSAQATSAASAVVTGSSGVQHLEYVFEDGLVSVYDMDQKYKLVKTISLPQTEGTEGFKGGIRGVAACPPTHMLFVSYGGDGGPFGTGSVLAYDLVGEKVVWTVHLEPFGIDSGAVSPDCKKLYMPSGENESNGIWNILDTKNGEVIGTIQGGKSPHNTIASNDGRYVYLGGREHEYLDVYETTTGKVREIGPLKSSVRPFTVNGSNTLAFTTATEFDGFQVSSITTGKVLFTVSFAAYPNGFPFTTASHGISLSPDESQLYVIDAVDREIQVYNVSEVSKGVAPTPLGVVPVAKPGLEKEESLCAYDCGRGGWLQRSIDGRFVFVGDSGEVIETATRKVIATLPTLLNTKKSLEIDWSGGVPIATSNRTGVGGVG
jgi:DNA-binding beta-propeller fold protein YncE